MTLLEEAKKARIELRKLAVCSLTAKIELKLTQGLDYCEKLNDKLTALLLADRFADEGFDCSYDAFNKLLTVKIPE